MKNLLLTCGFILAINVKIYISAPTPQDNVEVGDSEIHNEGSGMDKLPFGIDHEDEIVPTCLSKKTNPYTFFSTKTTYLHPEIGNVNTDIIQLPSKFQKLFPSKLTILL